MPRLHLTHVTRIQVVSTCIPCRRLHVSCIGDKIYITLHVSTCIQGQNTATCRLIQVAHPVTCIWCKCSHVSHMPMSMQMSSWESESETMITNQVMQCLSKLFCSTDELWLSHWSLWMTLQIVGKTSASCLFHDDGERSGQTHSEHCHYRRVTPEHHLMNSLREILQQ